MSILKYLKKIEHMDSLIARKATGSCVCFAKKVGMSKSMLHEYLKEMKEMGFPIKYCRERQSYYYEQDGKIVKSLFQVQMSQEEMREKKGGILFQFEFDRTVQHDRLNIFSFL